MRKITYFVAASLDGYIARQDGSVDWLFQDQDYGYSAFFDSVDTVIMGHSTYLQAITLGEFPFRGKSVYVLSRSQKEFEDTDVRVISEKIPEILKKIRERESDKGIWLVGGGQVAGLLLNLGMLDEVIVSVHPVVLSAGIPLFSGLESEVGMEVGSTTSYRSGLVQIRYEITR